MSQIYSNYLDTPLGRLLLTATDDALFSIRFPDADNTPVEPADDVIAVKTGEHTLLREVQRQLVAYFNGDLMTFALPVDPQGTDFQKQVWRTLQRIPMGETWTYKQLATAIGNSGAMRAVGSANNANPIPIVIPCHRVIGADGSLVGFGGGLDRKRQLLIRENAWNPDMIDPQWSQMSSV